MTADIEKMYRQINVHPSHRSLQRIIWRSDPNKPLNCYELNTLTYGTSPASFLSTRCLVQLASENQDAFPVECQSIRQDFYVDDFISGCETVSEGIELRRNVESILASAGFNLRKWVSNDARLLEGVPQDASSQYILTDDGNIKTLGVSWDSVNDDFFYATNVSNRASSGATKRTILSLVAQVFDPLGFVGPVILKAKLILQKLWQLQLDWDDIVPEELQSSWFQLYNQFFAINSIRVPRRMLISKPVEIQIHAFSDASELAYGACVYLRSRDDQECYLVRIICSKSRVAPLKTISLPRLELCGALLMAQLVERVLKALELQVSSVHYWCDSTITLHWIAREANNWKTFVAHRVAKIQNLTKNGQWHHVRSADNPADIVSRGSDPAQLAETPLWWNGPFWLCKDANRWPDYKIPSIREIPESKTVSLVCVPVAPDDIFFASPRF